MRVIWVTDIHLNFLGVYLPLEYQKPLKRYGSPQEFGKALAALNCDAVVITGDISEAPDLRKNLQKLCTGWGSKKPLYFVLGNHDYYHGSFESVHKDVEAFTKPPLVWLTKAGVVELSPETALVGSEGWYDGRAADPLASGVVMSDFTNIKDFRGKHEMVIHQQMREIARKDADAVAIPLRAACAKYKNVLFATHVPPFPETAWHEGQTSNDHWLPWMCNLTLGEKLIEIAYEFPDTKIVALCGHTHSPGEATLAPNLQVLTGKADYWYPQVSRVLELP